MCLQGAPDPPKMPQILPPPPMPSPMYKEPEDPPMLDMEPEARGKTPREQMKSKRRGYAQFRVRNPGLVIKNKR